MDLSIAREAPEAVAEQRALLRQEPAAQLLGATVCKAKSEVAHLGSSGFRFLGLRSWGLEFGVWGFGFGVWGLGFGVEGRGLRVVS